ELSSEIVDTSILIMRGSPGVGPDRETAFPEVVEELADERLQLLAPLLEANRGAHGEPSSRLGCKRAGHAQPRNLGPRPSWRPFGTGRSMIKPLLGVISATRDTGTSK